MSYSYTDPNTYLSVPKSLIEKTSKQFAKEYRRQSKKQLIEQAKADKQMQQSSKEYTKNFHIWRDYDLLTCMLAMVGLLLTITDYEYCNKKALLIVKNIEPQPTDPAYVTNQERMLLSEVSLSRVIVVMISGLSVCTLFFRHKKKANWLNEDLPKEMRASLFIIGTPLNQIIFRYRKVLTFWFWLEAFILIICPVPYFDFIITIQAPAPDRDKEVPIYYLLSDFILAFMFIRFFILMRSVFNYTIFMDMYSKKVCKTFNFTANVRFAYKCFLKYSPGLTIFCTILTSVLIGAYLYHIFELPYAVANNLLKQIDYFTCCWLMVITLTTVGYGDVYPSTVFGRCLIMCIAFWGTFLISLMIMSVSMVFSLKDTEQKALHNLLQTRRAARAITAAMRYWLAKKKFLRSSVSDEVMFEDRVELTDISTYKREMLVSLAEFMDNKENVKEFEKAKDDSVSVALIKHQVLEMADKFDKMQANQAKQGLLLSYIVNQQASGAQQQEEILGKQESFDQMQQQISQAQNKLRQLQQKFQMQFGGSQQQETEIVDQVAAEMSEAYLNPSAVVERSFRQSPFWQRDVLKDRQHEKKTRTTVMETVKEYEEGGNGKTGYVKSINRQKTAKFTEGTETVIEIQETYKRAKTDRIDQKFE